MNRFVMAQNGNRMPVHTIYNLSFDGDERHVLMTDSTKYNFLGDIIPIPENDHVIDILSFGDVLIYSYYVTGLMILLSGALLTIALIRDMMII